MAQLNSVAPMIELIRHTELAAIIADTAVPQSTDLRMISAGGSDADADAADALARGGDKVACVEALCGDGSEGVGDGGLG